MDTRVTLTIPEELFQNAKNLAVLLNRDVEDVLSEAIQLESVTVDAAERPEITAEREAFLKLHPRLFEQYPWEYVAILEGRLVDRDPNLSHLAGRIRTEYPRRFVLIRQVRPDPEIVYQFRSPRLPLAR